MTDAAERSKSAGAEALARVRVIDLETAGDGPHDVCEIGWQDVVRGAGGDWRLGVEGGARFVNPGRAISADTMAIHHILDAQVAEAPFWKIAAPRVLRPEGVAALAAHRAAFEQRYCRPSLTGGSEWICRDVDVRFSAGLELRARGAAAPDSPTEPDQRRLV